MKVKITLIEEMLGTKAANKDVFADFIASKAPATAKLGSAIHREAEARQRSTTRSNGEAPNSIDRRGKAMAKSRNDTQRKAMA